MPQKSKFITKKSIGLLPLMTTYRDMLKSMFPGKMVVFCAEDLRIIAVSSSQQYIRRALKQARKDNEFETIVVTSVPYAIIRAATDEIRQAQIRLAYLMEPSPKMIRGLNLRK